MGYRLSLFGVFAAVVLSVACTPLRPLPISGGAHVEFIDDDWCMITMPELTGRSEFLRFEDLVYVLEGRSKVSIGLYSYTHKLPKRFAFTSGGQPLFEHKIGFEGDLDLAQCYETELAGGQTYQVECEYEQKRTTPGMRRFALSGGEREALMAAFTAGPGAWPLEVQSLRTIRRFSVPSEAKAYLADPEAACRDFARQSQPY